MNRGDQSFHGCTPGLWRPAFGLNGRDLFTNDAADVRLCETTGHQAAFADWGVSLADRTRATSRFRVSAGMRPSESFSIAKATATLGERLPVSIS